MGKEPSIFDYVKYDEISEAKQAKLKAAAQDFEAAIDACDAAHIWYQQTLAAVLADGEHKDRAVEKSTETGTTVDALVILQESYIWAGKALRDEQIARNNGNFELQEERKDG